MGMRSRKYRPLKQAIRQKILKLLGGPQQHISSIRPICPKCGGITEPVEYTGRHGEVIKVKCVNCGGAFQALQRPAFIGGDIQKKGQKLGYDALRQMHDLGLKNILIMFSIDNPDTAKGDQIIFFTTDPTKFDAVFIRPHLNGYLNTIYGPHPQ